MQWVQAVVAVSSGYSHSKDGCKVTVKHSDIQTVSLSVCHHFWQCVCGFSFTKRGSFPSISSVFIFFKRRNVHFLLLLPQPDLSSHKWPVTQKWSSVSYSTQDVTWERKRQAGARLDIQALLNSHTATLWKFRGQTECVHAASDQASPQRDSDTHAEEHL